MYKLRIEKGPEEGKTLPLPEDGLSLGRSSQNDVAIRDEMLSRRHCRFYFEDGVPVVADLATVNGTQVNGVSIQEATRLRPGDAVAIGVSVLRLSDPDGSFTAPPAPSAVTATIPAVPAAPAEPAPPPSAEPAPPPEPAAPAEPPAAPAPAPEPVRPSSGPASVDLGFGPADRPAAPARTSKLLVNTLFGCAAAVLLAFAAKILLGAPKPVPHQVSAEPPPPPPLEFSYVKLQGSDKAVFRYQMDLGADGCLAVTIDDTAENRHVRKVSEPLSEDVRADLAQAFARNGFASLRPEYGGRARENEFSTLRLSALLEGRAFTVSVRNFPPPEDLRALCESLETFALTELGLWAAAYGRDDLVARAATEFNRGALLFEQRAVEPSNLYEAVRAFAACLANLDSLDPKPELFDRAVERHAEAAKLLDDTIAELEKSAAIATNTKDWSAAAAALSEILEYVPERTDERNRSAFRRLREVQERVK
jgi:hypothetical protein